MALNIKNERVCRLAKQAAELTGRSQVSVLEEALEAYLAEAERDQVRARRMQAAEEFIKDIKKRYDFVFFDSPPIMGVSDVTGKPAALESTVSPAARASVRRKGDVGSKAAMSPVFLRSTHRNPLSTGPDSRITS